LANRLHHFRIGGRNGVEHGLHLGPDRFAFRDQVLNLDGQLFSVAAGSLG